MHFIDDARSNDPQKGLALLPKRNVDTTVCEIGRYLRLLTNWCEIVSFQVPRKADTFQKDIYPETYAGIPSMSADEWLAGGNKPPVLKSLQPGAGGAAMSSPKAFVAAKTPSAAEVEALRAQTVAQAARIAELEAELAQLKVSGDVIVIVIVVVVVIVSPRYRQTYCGCASAGALCPLQLNRGRRRQLFFVFINYLLSLITTAAHRTIPSL